MNPIKKYTPLDKEVDPSQETLEIQEEPTTIEIGNETYILGEIKERYEGFFELYDEPQHELALKTSRVIMSKVAEVVQAAGIGITNDGRGFQAVVFNPNTRTYICLDISSLTQHYEGNLRRDVNIYLSDGTNIEAAISYEPTETEGTYQLASPSSIFLRRSNVNIQSLKDSYRLYGHDRQAIEEAPDLEEATKHIVEQIRGELADPYEVIYGNYSDADLIKEYLSKNRLIVDPETKTVLELLKPEYSTTHLRRITPAIEHDYDKVLKEAREDLRKKLWKEGFNGLAERLKRSQM